MNKNDINRDETLPLSSLQALGHQQTRVSLLLYHATGVEAVTLGRGQAIVVGRAAPADVAVPDPSLSRQHARFELSEDDVLQVEDLGSTNGTTVNGAAVERTELQADDEVVLGRVTVSLYMQAAATRGVESRERFAARLEDEVSRARFFERGLCLMLVQHDGAAAPPLQGWCPAVQQRLRSVDRVGLHGSGTLAVLMPEADEELATRVAQTVIKESSGDGLALRFAVAAFPEDGGSAAKLTELCRVALQRADADGPLVSATTAQDPQQWVEQAAPAGEGVAAAAGAVVRSEAMQKLFNMVERLSRSTIPVLIIGETGTGKEIVARAIHEGGDRKGGPIRCVNCAAIPDQLIESALFGHERGAFTGATQRSSGIFEEADGGTVMLDEVGELSPSAQAALLRVLETKQITRVGSSKEVAVDVRVVAATHRDLEAMCDAGTFRWDLLYRLNTMMLRVPPLRRRSEEIEPLAQRFLELAREQDPRTPVREISGEALTVLRTYHWPGNVRELRNEIERAVVVAEGEVITAEDLSERVGGGSEADVGVGEVESGRTFKDLVQTYETRVLLDALRKNDWNQAAVVRELKIPMRTLTNKVKAYELHKSKG